MNTTQQTHKMVDTIFQEILPHHGLAVRDSQIALCHQMLDALLLGEIALCDAGTGIGKTYAYLVACVVWMQARPQHIPTPVTISTASVALQDAILTEYLPFLSAALLQAGIIQKPLLGVIRKGKERFACDVRLQDRLERMAESPVTRPRTRQILLQLVHNCDMDTVQGLSNFDRALISVPQACHKTCAGWGECQYHQYLKAARATDVTFQICNHNYLLADASHCLQGYPPLLKEYRALVVDEAHKLPEAAQQMQTRTFSPATGEELSALLVAHGYTKSACRLSEAVGGLWAAFDRAGESTRPNSQDSTQEPCAPNVAQRAALAAVTQRLGRSARHLAAGLPRWVTHRMEEAAELLDQLRHSDDAYIRYIEYDSDGHASLCATSKENPAWLAEALWTRIRPNILTSGTLLAGGSFLRAEQQLGLVGNPRLRLHQAPSPFDYEQNCLLYIPEAPPRQMDTVTLAQQIEMLVRATHGHALLLFTSYRLMDEVQRYLSGKISFPMLKAWRGRQKIIMQFKAMPNAVLFAAGPCWEGIDFPGDCVSLLVIVRLPFPVPNVLSEAEKDKYTDLQEYIQDVIVPEMQRKLRQGFGRAVRLETDTCVVAILDHRAAPGQRYHDAVRQALPPCPITDNIEDIKQFIRDRKAPDYFLP